MACIPPSVPNCREGLIQAPSAGHTIGSAGWTVIQGEWTKAAATAGDPAKLEFLMPRPISSVPPAALDGNQTIPSNPWWMKDSTCPSTYIATRNGQGRSRVTLDDVKRVADELRDPKDAFVFVGQPKRVDATARTSVRTDGSLSKPHIQKNGRVHSARFSLADRRRYSP